MNNNTTRKSEEEKKSKPWKLFGKKIDGTFAKVNVTLGLFTFIYFLYANFVWTPSF
jgi:hypothetical protein